MLNIQNISILLDGVRVPYNQLVSENVDTDALVEKSGYRRKILTRGELIVDYYTQEEMIVIERTNP